ncbi:MAG: hypothetical protein A2W26_00590 [Acidobacteria bacterium RBG_16_64_8]|nr:MAG: hypothetical protein A2W26_00590 [Acidobacteria bacterium RBG_16_64_8]
MEPLNGTRAFLAAEISGNHNGDLSRALALVHAAARTGADGVKFQAFTLNEIVGLRGDGQAPPPWDSMTLPELYTKLHTPLEWLPTLFAEALGLGLMPFASVFGKRSLEALEACRCPLYKIAKPERHNSALILMVRATLKPVLISGIDVYCPGGYPCRPEELQLRAHLAEYDGLSCHCPDPMVGAVAAALGAKYIEYHVTLDDGVPTLDDPVNLTASQFADMVRMVRQAEAML